MICGKYEDWQEIKRLIVRRADKILVSGGGLKNTHTGNTRGPPGVKNCNPDNLIW